MDNKNNIQIGIGGLILIILIIAIITAAIVMGISYFNTDNANKNQVSQENSISNKVENDENIGKIDKSKDLVYKAEYSNNLSDTSYVLFDNTYTVEDFCVPYININSEDGKKANEEIKEIYDDFIKFFEEMTKNTEKTSYEKASYNSYINDNILSVIITVENGGTDVENYKYYTYNFDLNTLKLLNYESIYQKAGYTTENIEEKVINAINNYEEYENVENNQEIDSYKNNTINNYKKSVQDNSIEYYLNSNKELSVIVTIELPVGIGQFEKIITIK